MGAVLGNLCAIALPPEMDPAASASPAGGAAVAAEPLALGLSPFASSGALMDETYSEGEEVEQEEDIAENNARQIRRADLDANEQLQRLRIQCEAQILAERNMAQQLVDKSRSDAESYKRAADLFVLQQRQEMNERIRQETAITCRFSDNYDIIATRFNCTYIYSLSTSVTF